jgi:hypothetical protein
MLQLVPSSFEMDDFYILICGNMLLCIQFYIYIGLCKYVTMYNIIYFCKNTLPKNLSFKIQTGFICLN